MIKLFLQFLVLSLLFTGNIFASSGEIKQKTLFQMQTEKQELEKQESVLQFKWSTFKLGNESLGDIMRENLTQEEKDDLEDIINIYVKDKDYLERKIEKYISSQKEIVDLKEELLRGKHQFYKDLIIYIQIEKLEAFKQYVDSDLNYNEKSKDIQDKIEQKNVEQSERIDELRNQIDDNSMNFRRQIEEKITVQVSDKLDIFVNQESFQELSAESKIKVFTNIINKFESAIDKLENTSNPTAVLAERIIGLEVVVSILESYIDNWK